MDWYVQEIARAHKSSIGHTRGIVRPCNRISGHSDTNMINMQQQATKIALVDSAGITFLFIWFYYNQT